MFEDGLGLLRRHPGECLEDGGGLGFALGFEELRHIRAVTRTMVHPAVGSKDRTLKGEGLDEGGSGFQRLLQHRGRRRLLFLKVLDHLGDDRDDRRDPIQTRLRRCWGVPGLGQILDGF